MDADLAPLLELGGNHLGREILVRRHISRIAVVREDQEGSALVPACKS